ncbi:tail fiber domain-containing protein [Hymenobacter gummosus]|uniref:Tail fiber domain-containing protein n=1 Tax=Hymenobacter gummosus TaxID=1776032 RepID=A0A431U0X5_9BACT|nr:tail fiber domain-containing protein [Hymenobacter gummosus]RTQ48535.1 tail fiber domain-containing protein [Hymenobacter gummosus]
MNNFFPRLTALLLGGLLGASVGAQAQNVGIGTTTPAARLDVNGDFKVATTAGGGQISQATKSAAMGSNRVGQSFTMPGAASITSVAFQPYGTAPTGGTLRIYPGDGTSATPLHTQSVSVPNNHNGDYVVTLTTPLAVAAGSYTFQFEFGSQCNFYGTSTNSYAGGRLVADGYPYPAYDLTFAVSYQAASVQALYASSTGNVGIGTTAPGQRLEVAGNVLLSGGGSGLIFPDGTKQTTASTAAAGLTASSPLSGSGTSASPLTVATASGSQPGVLSAADYTAFSNKFTLPSLSSGAVLFSNGSTLAQNTGKLFWDDASGRLGVGTAAPGNTLTVNGDFLVGSTAGTLELISQPYTGVATSGTRLGQSFTMPSAGALTSIGFQPYANNALTGTLRVYQGNGTAGTQLYTQSFTLPANNTGEFAVALSTPLTVAAGTYTFLFDLSGQCPLQLSTSNPYSGGQEWRDGFSSSNYDMAFSVAYRVGAGSQALYASSSGNVGIGTTTPGFKLDVNGAIRCVGAVNTTSDQRLKEQIRPLGGALARVQALRGVRYTFRHAQYPALNLPQGEQIGLLAQEVETVFPELVSTDAQGYKAVNYAQLAPVLIEALKEQQRQIEQLRHQNSALQADHADLLVLKQQVARLQAQQPAVGPAGQ